MSSLRLLCIDDTVSVLSLLEKTLPLLLQGEVRVASGSHEALEVMSGGFIPDVILMDYMMPTRSGIELAHALKQNPAFAKTCIILHSAVGSSVRRAALAAGVYDAIDKPTKPKDLAQAIVAILKSFRDGVPSKLAAPAPQPLARIRLASADGGSSNA